MLATDPKGHSAVPWKYFTGSSARLAKFSLEVHLAKLPNLQWLYPWPRPAGDLFVSTYRISLKNNNTSLFFAFIRYTQSSCNYFASALGWRRSPEVWTVSIVTMSSWMNARVFALFCFIQAFSFTIEAAEATQQDSCARGIKTLTAQMGKLQADIRAIAIGLGLLDPSGTVLQPPCFQILCYLNWYTSNGKTENKHSVLYSHFFNVTTTFIAISHTGSFFTSCRDIYRNQK